MQKKRKKVKKNNEIKQHLHSIEPDLPRAHSNFERNPTQTQFFDFRLTQKN
jgi:hypothetical protein